MTAPKIHYNQAVYEINYTKTCPYVNTIMSILRYDTEIPSYRELLVLVHTHTCFDTEIPTMIEPIAIGYFLVALG
jgi:hypothetical protein